MFDLHQPGPFTLFMNVSTPSDRRAEFARKIKEVTNTAVIWKFMVMVHDLTVRDNLTEEDDRTEYFRLAVERLIELNARNELTTTLEALNVEVGEDGKLPEGTIAITDALAGDFGIKDGSVYIRAAEKLLEGDPTIGELYVVTVNCVNGQEDGYKVSRRAWRLLKAKLDEMGVVPILTPEHLHTIRAATESEADASEAEAFLTKWYPDWRPPEN